MAAVVYVLHQKGGGHTWFDYVFCALLDGTREAVELRAGSWTSCGHSIALVHYSCRDRVQTEGTAAG